MINSSAKALRGAPVVLGSLGLLALSYGVGSQALSPAHAAGAQAGVAAVPATAAAAVAVSVGFQATVPSTGVVHHRIEPADGSIALARQAHQVPLLIVLGVAPGSAKLLLEYADGHSEVRPIAVSAAPPASVETVRIRVGQVREGKSAANLKSFSAAKSGLVDVQVAPNNHDYIIRAIKPGTASLILIQEDSSIQQKMVEVTP